MNKGYHSVEILWFPGELTHKGVCINCGQHFGLENPALRVPVHIVGNCQAAPGLSVSTNETIGTKDKLR